MKIGILTFHSEINYGSVLQALALQTHLEFCGHDVVIIDKYEDARNSRLLGPLAHLSLIFWAGYIARAFLLSGGWRVLLRHIKTMRMIRRYLKRTPYHFYKWNDAPKDLGVNVILVGSDQVWNPIIVDPTDYLLGKVPGDVPGIAYAASIGQHELPKAWRGAYVEGFRRFKAIGVRELEAKRLVESTGTAATHVVDPTLLVDPAICWNRFRDNNYTGKKRLFCYLMTLNVCSVMPRLLRFAERMDAEVDVFVNAQTLPVPSLSAQSWSRWIGLRRMLSSGRVKLCLSGSPDDFVSTVSRASWCVTESFHGLMFSIIFRKNVRVVICPNVGGRGAMSSRLTEFADEIVRGPLIKSSLDDALSSIEQGEQVSFDEQKLEQRIQTSREWLDTVLKGVCSHDE